MKLQYRLGTAIASTALMFNLLAPAAFADTTVDISGNGSNSDNNVSVNNTSNATINQSNNLTVGLNINSTASTGGNKANGNTGGDVSIDTGNANSTVNITVLGGSNEATIEGCGCNGATDNITVADNGSNTTNNATVKNKKDLTAKQKGNTTVGANVNSKTKTGKNKAKNNTNGTVNVTTGNSTSNVSANVTAGNNTLNITP